MSMAAYYNEIDPKAAAWLRELIKQGHIADGDVDDRSIEDVRPVDLLGFDQCHFFAGIGVWSYALRRAGWSDDRPVWTGSCPCQPFSAAGKGAGFADERHLWPAFHHLISQCRPDVVFGEQVASKDGLGWLDLVQSDLDATGYASGAVDLCAAGIGAPHIRQRLWWVGKRLADTDHASKGMVRNGGVSLDGGETWNAWAGLGGSSSNERLADTTIIGRGEGIAHDGGLRGGDCAEGSVGRSAVYGDLGGGSQRPGSTNGFWRDADWLFCRDGKWRAVETGTSPLAHGSAARVGRLRGYGNAIVAQAAQAFVESVM